MNELRITQYEAGQRLDKFLLKYLNKASPGFLHKMLRKKRIKLNGMRASGGEVLDVGDLIKLYLAPETMDQFMSARGIGAVGALDIVYEDEQLLALNKPRGLLSHAADNAAQDTLIDRCLAYLHARGVYTADKTSVFVPALCNRLDRNTSGLVLCGKTPAALRELNRAFATRGPDKHYLAVVVGTPPPAREILSFHQKDAVQNRAVAAAYGKEMITSLTTLTTNGSYSLLSVRLVTGRSHQIRAQLSAIGFPIAGDVKYGGRVAQIPWQLLHAERIVFAGMQSVLEYLNGKELNVPPDAWFISSATKLLGEDVSEHLY